MIGLVGVVTASVAFIVAVAVFGKRPPPLLLAQGYRHSVGRWAALLGQTTQPDQPVAPGQYNPSGWYAGSPVEPLEFSRQLTNLHSALRPVKHNAPTIEHDKAPSSLLSEAN